MSFVKGVLKHLVDSDSQIDFPQLALRKSTLKIVFCVSSKRVGSLNLETLARQVKYRLKPCKRSPKAQQARLRAKSLG
jgi:hypothetical protein